MNWLLKLKQKRIHISLPLALILVVLAAIATTLLMFQMQPMGMQEVWIVFRESGYITPLLNFLPVLLLMLFLFFATGNTVLSIGLAGFVMAVMSFVNRYKIKFRNDPFFPYDFALAPELMGIVKSFGRGMIFMYMLLVLLGIVLGALLLYFIRTRPFSKKVRAAGAVTLFLCMVWGNKTLYCDTALYQSLPVIGNIYNHKDVFNGRGFLYSFLYTLNTSRVEKPEGYNADQIVRYIETSLEESDGDPAVRPHIMVIMSEAFSEVSDHPQLNFDRFVDPLANYKEIKQQSIAGRMVVPNLGGGTGDTEFDFLTGANTRFLRGAPFAYRLVMKDFEALPGLLRRVGYQADAIHPGHAWFYNRQNVYTYMGFESFYSLDDFDPKEEKGMYITEKACFDKIIEVFENRDPQKPHFSFTVTIENHGPYPGKFGVDTNFDTDLSLSPEDVSALSNYFEGAVDADVQLGRIVDYLEAQEEPVVLVFFGDHLPAFQASAYQALYGSMDSGSLEDRIKLYAPPFLIWQNQACRELVDLQEKMDGLYPEGEPLISSFYLGGLMLELLDMKGVSPFFDYVNGLRQEFPVILENEYYSEDGAVGSVDDVEELKMYLDWNFYQIFDS